ncbi:MAG: hypothetical protein ACLGH0_04280, partial [Thermoanaerobaculia bacterium]
MTAQTQPTVARRAAIAVLLAALAGVGLLHWLLTRRFADATEARAERAAMIVARAAADVATQNPAALSAWQKEHRSVRAVRVVNVDDRELVASTFAVDLKEGELPRRLQRPEKELFDLAQELRANIETNVAENAKREKEVSVARQPDGTFLITAPIEKDGSIVGFAQVHAAPEVVAVETPSFWFALAFALAPFVLIFALSFFIHRHSTLVVIAAALLLLSLLAYRQWSGGSLEGGTRTAEQRFAERVQREAQIAARTAPGAEANAKTWDADVHRVPLKIDPVRATAGEKAAIANASYGIAVLALALLLFVGLGAAERTTRSLIEHRRAYAYVAPAMFGMLLLVFFPFLYGVTLSFTGQTIYTVNEPLSEIWTGFRNYTEILGDFGVIKHTAGGGRVAN